MPGELERGSKLRGDWNSRLDGLYERGSWRGALRLKSLPDERGVMVRGGLYERGEASERGVIALGDVVRSGS